jgi:hypothetical protein
MEAHINILKEVYNLLEPLKDNSLSAEDRTRILKQASEMTKTLKAPNERTPELEHMINVIRRRMFGYTD